ncbi:cyclin-dependent kinase C-2-like [Ornithorhynchus anatinus]|uniref:cyclin-dependent kinase C-2-like n=1 Tax=Ornithorhynchus anatinus TaxID=9258 RepID=UPI0019D4D9AE|nr:cyclin-dependent kinase C-2-like [Ornithorhynchus anatinus]
MKPQKSGAPMGMGPGAGGLMEKAGFGGGTKPQIAGFGNGQGAGAFPCAGSQPGAFPGAEAGPRDSAGKLGLGGGTKTHKTGAPMGMDPELGALWGSIYYL